MFGFRSARLCLQELEKRVGQEVCLSGWVTFVRKTREVTFIGLRNSALEGSQLLQIVLPNAKVNGIKLEDVVTVDGLLEQRPSPSAGNSLSFEIKAKEIKVENRCNHPLPLDPKQQSVEQTPQQRDASLTHRYLDLRIRPHLQRNLQIRSIAALAMRNHLSSAEAGSFLEVETPTLFKSTPEGAREFLVPVAASEGGQPKFYALVQSPQQYKQMLMVGGVDRYYQFARCYRDEGGRADRQPEFTQLDMEMAFVNRCEHVQAAVEQVVCAGWRAAHEKFPDVVPAAPKRAAATTPNSVGFFQMPFPQAMREYGSDKPNLSFAMRIQNNGTEMRAPKLAPALSKREKSDLIRQLTTLGQVKVADVEFQPEDVVVHSDQVTKLGRCRLILHEWMERKGVAVPPGILPKHVPFWVTDFTLFDAEETGNGVCSTHHPFTAPHPEDLTRLEEILQRIRNGDVEAGKRELLGLRALHYDLVCDGMELGGGSIRIHNSELQARLLRDALGISELDCKTQFGHLLDALALGAPPHGGFALGFDRFISLLCQTSSLSDTLAFPKSSTGTDPLTGAPCVLTEKQSAEVLPRFALQQQRLAK